MGITWQPLARFLQVIPHLVQNFMIKTSPIFFLNFSLTWGLGPNTWIWGKWAQNGFWGITWQPPVRFFRTTPHFIQNFMKKTGVFFIENLDPKGLGPSIEI